MTRSLASASAPGVSPATDALRRILWRLDDYEQPVFMFEEVRRWPKGQLDRFVELGLVRKGGMADATIYYDCEQHCDIDYDPQTLPNGRVVITHRCVHGCGLAVLEPERFQLWDIRFEGLAAWVSNQLGLGGECAPVVRDRIVMLGAVNFGSATFEVFLARGVRRADAASVMLGADRLHASASPLVLVPSELPPTNLWSARTPIVASLEELLSDASEFLRLDVDRLMVATRVAAASGHIGPDQTDMPVLTQIEVDLLEALSRSPHEAMLQVEIGAAAGYSKSATRVGLDRLRELNFVAKPRGKARKGDAITSVGRAYLGRRAASVRSALSVALKSGAST